MMIVTTRVLYDSNRNAVVQLTGRNDGMGGDSQETNVTKIKVSDLLPSSNRQLNITKVTFAVGGGAVELKWAGDDPQPFLFLQGVGKFNYRFIKGASNPGSQDNTISGDISLSTFGFDLNSTYSILLEMVKT